VTKAACAIAFLALTVQNAPCSQVIQGYLSRGEARSYALDVSAGSLPSVRLTAPDGFILVLYDPLDRFVNGGVLSGGWLVVRTPKGAVGVYTVKVVAESISGNYRLTVDGTTQSDAGGGG
jgi:hypothetical protein